MTDNRSPDRLGSIPRRKAREGVATSMGDNRGVVTGAQVLEYVRWDHLWMYEVISDRTKTIRRAAHWKRSSGEVAT